MATTSLGTASSSLCIPIKTGKKRKSDWKQWMTPIKVMEGIREAICEGTSYRKIGKVEALNLWNNKSPRLKKTSWSDGDFAKLPIAKAIAQATECRKFEDGALELVYKPNPRDPGLGEFIQLTR